ncbi:MAG: hypothetical protein JNK82_37940 [Myxococcaceae bacterium]|nr:hypothetical protein [Myxococcaceae bacterium]
MKRIASCAFVLGGDLQSAVWGVRLPDDARAMMGRLVEDELDALRDVSIESAEVCFREGRAVDALGAIASVLSRSATGPRAERALALLLGPMLRPGGAEALRAAMFRT